MSLNSSDPISKPGFRHGPQPLWAAIVPGILFAYGIQCARACGLSRRAASVFKRTLLLAGLLAVSSQVRADSIGTPTVGWSGNYQIGRWTPVTVPVTVDAASTVQLELTAVDSDGNRVGYLSPPTSLEPGVHRLTSFFKVGRLDGDVQIQLLNAGKPSSPPLRGAAGRTEWLSKPLRPSTRLILTVGNPQGLGADSELTRSGSMAHVSTLSWADLPTDQLAYDSVATLVVAGTGELLPAQAAAIKDWVASGGRLVVSLRHDVSEARRQVAPFADWFPVRVGEQPAIVREFGGLEAYSGKNIRVPWTSTLSIPSLQSDVGENLATSRSDAFLIRAPYALGSVSVLAMDLTAAPMTEWKSLVPFCERLAGITSSLDVREKTVSKGTQLSSTGITDLATQIHATQENFESVRRASPWTVLGLLVLLVLLIGPLDYLIVSKILKKPLLTWMTFPLLILLGAWAVSSWAAASNGSVPRLNQLDIVNVDVATATARGRHFYTLYSPATTKTSVSIQPLPLVDSSKSATSDRVSWHGVPESTFGGMFRDVGIEQGAKYSQEANGTITDLPVIQWSSKALIAESVQSVAGLVDCDLKASSTGRLVGSITHRFAGPIEDWMVVYRNVVYRHLKKKDDAQTLSFAPKVIFQVDQPSVYSRELKPFLTGMITMATPKFGQASISDTVHHQFAYNSLSLNPAMILRTLTFHDEIGGERYTGLTNQLLETEDCSHLIRLGRAILFGRLSQPVSTIERDQKTTEPDRQAAFVRLILPVARPTEVMKDLRRVVPD